MRYSIAALLLAPVALAAPTPIFRRQSDTSIDDMIKAKGKKYFGAATDQGLLESGGSAEVLKANFGQVTPENSMKWKSVEAERGQFTFDQADFLVNWAASNGKLVRGHTLLWHNELPDWVSAISDRDELAGVVENHVRTIVGRYKGRVYAWDVVNEIFEGEDGSKFRDSVFYQLLGEDFVSIAFRAAREADPDAKLYINDFNLNDATWPKLTGLVEHVSRWLEAGVPIDGIGSQSHLAAGLSSKTQGALEALAASGVSEVAITELDIPGAPDVDYAGVVSACLAVEKCVGITTWGVSDVNSWQADKKPLLFDGDMKPKQTYSSVIEALS